MYTRDHKILSLILFFFIVLNFNFSIAATKKNIQINNIIVKNNQRIDTETILTYLNLNTGDSVNYEILNKKLKEMYKLGLFADIKLRLSNNNLIVLIKENPMVNNVYFVGNKRIKEDQIRGEIQLKSRNVFQKNNVPSVSSCEICNI